MRIAVWSHCQTEQTPRFPSKMQTRELVPGFGRCIATNDDAVAAMVNANFKGFTVLYWLKELNWSNYM